MPPPLSTSKSHAFSLVEVVLAIGIASFFLLATMGLLANGHAISSDAQNRTHMESIASKSFALVGEEVRAGHDPEVVLEGRVESFDHEGRAMADPTDWVYRCTLSFTRNGSWEKNERILRAEAQIESRRETRRMHQFFAVSEPSGAQEP